MCLGPESIFLYNIVLCKMETFTWMILGMGRGCHEGVLVQALGDACTYLLVQTCIGSRDGEV